MSITGLALKAKTRLAGTLATRSDIAVQCKIRKLKAEGVLPRDQQEEDTGTGEGDNAHSDGEGMLEDE